MAQRKAFLITSLLAVVGLGALAATSGKLAEGRYKLVGLFSQVVSLVRASYVEEVAVSNLEEGALTGLVTTVDPQGTWVPASVAAELRSYLARPLPPFGVVVGWQSSYPVVLQVLPVSPAARAGLVPGELIERVGEQPVRARPLWRVLVALEQAARLGQGVSLEVIARDFSGKRTLRLEPDSAGELAPRMEAKGGVALVRVPVISEAQVAKLAAMLPPAGPVVVDLRGTALGDPQGAVAAAALLLGGEVRLQLSANRGPGRVFRLVKPPVERKVVLCVDHTTAKAAEWLAYLLRQRGVALVGVETFGDTAVRTLVPVAEGELWVASQLLFDEENKPLLGKGMKPTQLVRPQKEGDPILEKALELALGQTQAQAA